MPMLRPAYEMKDSGIDAVKSIPKDWNVRRIKYLLKERNERVEDANPNDLLSVSEYYGVAPRAEKIKSDGTLMRAESLEGYKICKCNDLVVNIMLAWKGALGTSYYDGIVSPSYCVYTSISDDVDMKYLHYLFTTEAYKTYFRHHSTGIIESRLRLYSDELFSLWCLLPSIKEQQAIADYLDDRCSKIDEIIAEATASIEEYKELKQAVIFEAVTKGLDKTVPMKDSGVEWIGFIPKSWDAIRLKYLLTHLIDCPHETPNYVQNGDYYVIRTADQDLGFLRSDKNMYRLEKNEYLNRIRRLSLNKNDIVYGREGERWGLACLVPESNKYCLGQRMLHFRCKTNIVIPRFLMWSLNSEGVRMQGVIDTMGSTSPHVNISTVRNFVIPLPDLKKQQAIVDFLYDRISQIDSLISEKQALIEDLQAYKKSLIYEVVTGKRRVV